MSKLPFDKLNSWRSQLSRLPEVQMAVAEKAAAALNAFVIQAFDAGVTVYGGARPTGKDGRRLSLIESGAMRNQLRFIPRGTYLRCRLGVPYAKYNIRFGILPRGGQALPSLWEQAIKRIAQNEIGARMRVAA